MVLALVLSGTPMGAQTYKVIHAFGVGTDGGGLWSPVVLDAKGNLYGATSGGGNHGDGTVFKLTQMPGGEWSESILHNFPVSSTDGQVSIGGVVLDGAGNIYGTTEGGTGQAIHGMVYKLTPGPQWWSETILHRFGPSDVAGGPLGQLAIDGSGNLYGTGGMWRSRCRWDPTGGGRLSFTFLPVRTGMAMARRRGCD
jgi:uncharacterized repeat protein (TIGR03803 family)